MPQTIKDGTDFNEIKTPGMYFNNNHDFVFQNSPFPASTYSLLVEKTGAYSVGVKQTATHYYTLRTVFRTSNVDATGKWTEWTPIATATPPQEFDLPVSSGFIASGASFDKDQFKRVHIGGQIKKTIGSIQTDTEVIMTLPNDCLPAAPTTRAITIFGGGGAVVIDQSNGKVMACFAPTENVNTINCDFSYIAK